MTGESGFLGWNPNIKKVNKMIDKNERQMTKNMIMNVFDPRVMLDVLERGVVEDSLRSFLNCLDRNAREEDDRLSSDAIFFLFFVFF